MPSNTDSDGPRDVAAVVRRYRRLERPISAGIAVLVGLVAAVAIITLPLVVGLAVALAVFVAVRVPIFETGGTTTLSTQQRPDEVRAAFESASPPPLVFQWGLADEVEQTDGGWSYEISYLLGLRSVRLHVETHSGDDADLELVVTVGDQSWGTYRVDIEARDDETIVVIDTTSDRRFGLRRLPQWFVGQRYRVAALSAQGYTVVEQDARLTL
ncbi:MULTISPECIES: hypothetical protein [Halomicrobium]|uniref:Uncharacterized protein n=2 Tax=Halomicrobium mukohataei TaxID=57705 RepID=C7P2I4_HALMD|nr:MULTISPECIES: hypothetical protein [Halomicrobium]ACV49299.1 conserved hypothetical protein [Halomicrobium mukohataei DSM 12286]QCD64697.1 hypothetical protein E5139_03200 [Halomicrobium mukohataei]QFR19504.1 hypothetical protein GBQ70_03200 [Halomicrobium sp. ZPS1]